MCVCVFTYMHTYMHTHSLRVLSTPTWLFSCDRFWCVNWRIHPLPPALTLCSLSCHLSDSQCEGLTSEAVRGCGSSVALCSSREFRFIDRVFHLFFSGTFPPYPTKAPSCSLPEPWHTERCQHIMHIFRHAYIYTHTHKHTHIHIYIYIYVCIYIYREREASVSADWCTPVHRIRICCRVVYDERVLQEEGM